MEVLTFFHLADLSTVWLFLHIYFKQCRCTSTLFCLVTYFIMADIKYKYWKQMNRIKFHLWFEFQCSNIQSFHQVTAIWSRPCKVHIWQRITRVCVCVCVRMSMHHKHIMGKQNKITLYLLSSPSATCYCSNFGC